MKKILFLIDNLKGGGAEKAIKIHVEELTKRGYKPLLVLLENQKDYTLNKEVEVIYLSEKLSKFNFINIFFKFILILKENKPDIVISTNTKSDIIASFSKIFKKFEYIPNIQVNLKFYYHRKTYIFNLLKFLYKKFADRFYFISDGLYYELKDEFNIKNYFVIYNPISKYEIDTKMNETIENKYKKIFDKFTIINIGRLVEQKNQELLLKSFAKLGRNDINLVILGRGEKEELLKELAKKLNIVNNVYFLGFHKNPFKFLKNSDLFVLSSSWEGFGNVIPEAMQCKLPIISTDCPNGPREILSPNSNVKYRLQNGIKKEKYGILTPMYNENFLSEAINQMINDKNIYDLYTKKSIDRANDFNVDKLISQWVEILK